MISRPVFLLLIAAFAAAPTCCLAQKSSEWAPVIEPRGSAHSSNSNGDYVSLRGALPAGEGVRVKDLVLERQGGKFYFTEGTFYFYTPVRGKVTGAVFFGKGRFEMSPESASEQRSLSMLTKSSTMSQEFSSVVLRFTDDSAEEIKKASTGSGTAELSSAVSAGSQMQKMFRQRLHENLELRLLEDVLLAPAVKGGYFLASFRMGGALNGKDVLFTVDPEGTAHAAPDQVELATLDGDYPQTWVAYRLASKEGGESGLPIHVTSEDLDASFEHSGKMTGSAITSFGVLRDAVRVVRFNLYPTLRVSAVYDQDGAPLDFVQEDKLADPDFAVILPQSAKRGDALRILTRYLGSDAVKREGDGVYYLEEGARESWYPAGSESFGDFMPFRMTFHIPKDLQIVATGKEVSRANEAGGMQRVVWTTDSPIVVAGFSLGSFASKDTKSATGFDVSAYANVNLPDDIESFSRRISSGRGLTLVALGTMSTVPMLANEVAQGSAAVQIYTNYYGKLPYDHVALTEQSACNFGQSWPMLVYLPVCAFWDTTIQSELGLRSSGGEIFWEEVTPHEVAHQWWGHLVGFNSYRDQWMSEGFAQFSAGIYLLHTSSTMDAYREFWAAQRKAIVEKNKQGLRPIDVGPLTMGARVSNSKAGYDIYRLLIYGKGAYVLHMLEMMYWTPKYGEEPFKKSMQAFVQEYRGRSATTEDFKASMEKSMPDWVDMKHDHKLDWFFNEYVYGTELPHYDVLSDFTTQNGETSMHFKVTQSNVSKNFAMLVPIYLQMANGSTVRLLNLELHGNVTSEHTVNLGKLPAAAKKALVNYNADVLSD